MKAFSKFGYTFFCFFALTVTSSHSFHPSSPTNTPRSSQMSASVEDPYAFLEEVESERSLQFAKDANDACLSSLGNPKDSETYKRVLAFLESDDRIPYASKLGVDDNDNPLLFNFWKDSKNPKGLWRKTTLESYKTSNPEWTTVLNVDELAEKDGISWVYKGSRLLPRARDPMSNGGKRVTRALLSLSRGGSDAVHVKEFDLLTGDFVHEQPFHLPEAKTRASYKSRDVLLVGTDMGPDSLTDSGYPRTVREWVRGTDIQDAPVVFEGDKKDVSVSAYTDDQRKWHGPIYEVHARALDFYTSQHWVRTIQYEHLLAPNDPERATVADPPDFVEVGIPKDASLDFLGNLMIISLRSDWVVGNTTFAQGSLLTVNANLALDDHKGDVSSVPPEHFQVLFAPTPRTAYEYYTVTKNYLILVTMENVKTKVDFFKIGNEGSTLDFVGGDDTARIRSVSVSAVDSQESDEIWFTTSGYTQPSTLFLGDVSKVETNKNEQDAFVIQKLKSLPDMYDASNFTVQQGTATSKDGTEIPYFIVQKKDLVYDGNNPTLLYGYGGFEVSLGPSYIATTGIAWLEQGGVFVEANIRGGGEFGPSWHQAALKENRNKCYEDFIAVAESLIASNICRPSTLACRGGSNGGLLVSNMYCMRPDLWGAIHCAVPLTDMKRYHKLLAGASWMAEYGDPDTDDWDKFLHKYSPYHNIDENVSTYPPMLVTTSTRDDRVHPAHARKLVQKLWDMGKDKNWPVYYYENIEGGHGGAADAKQSAFMTSLAHDFMLSTLKKNIQNGK